MSERLLLDEMYPKLLAEALRDRGHDVLALVECPGGPGTPDEHVLELAVSEARCLLTENIGDFETFRVQRQHDGRPCCGLLYSSPNRFPRSKSGIGHLITALHERLTSEDLPAPGQVDWL